MPGLVKFVESLHTNITHVETLILGMSQIYGGFPKLGGTILGVPSIRIIVFEGVYWGPLILGNYHISSPMGWGEFNFRGGRVLEILEVLGTLPRCFCPFKRARGDIRDVRGHINFLDE